MFGLGLASAGYVYYSMLQANARRQVEDSAKIMMETALAMRRYTAGRSNPCWLPAAIQRRLRSS